MTFTFSRLFYPKRLTYVRLTMYTHFTFTLIAHCTSGAIRGSVLLKDTSTLSLSLACTLTHGIFKHAHTHYTHIYLHINLSIYPSIHLSSTQTHTTNLHIIHPLARASLVIPPHVAVFLVNYPSPLLLQGTQ